MIHLAAHPFRRGHSLDGGARVPSPALLLARFPTLVLALLLALLSGGCATEKGGPRLEAGGGISGAEERADGQGSAGRGEDLVAALTDEEVARLVQPRQWVPAAVLVLTTREIGETGPCGCPHRPGGGMARRTAFLRLLERTWPGTPVLPMLAGDWADPASADRTRKLGEALAGGGVVAANLGPRELSGGPEFLETTVRPTGLPVLSTNLASVSGAPVDAGPPVPASRILEAGGLRVGVLGVSEPVEEAGWAWAEPIRSVSEWARRLRPEVDFLLLLAVLPPEEVFRVAEAVPGLDLVYAGWQEKVLPEPVDVVGVPVLFGGDRGRWLTEVRLYGGGSAGLQAAEFVTHYLGEEVPRDPALLEWEMEMEDRFGGGAVAESAR